MKTKTKVHKLGLYEFPYISVTAWEVQTVKIKTIFKKI